MYMRVCVCLCGWVGWGNALYNVQKKCDEAPLLMHMHTRVYVCTPVGVGVVALDNVQKQCGDALLYTCILMRVCVCVCECVCV